MIDNKQKPSKHNVYMRPIQIYRIWKLNKIILILFVLFFLHLKVSFLFHKKTLDYRYGLYLISMFAQKQLFAEHLFVFNNQPT